MPVRLAARPFEKVWGSPLTEPWYRNSGNRQIGEVWFEASEAVPLLVKFLFTSDYLSVQVHPDDDYARVHEDGSPGKTEMWHVLRAEPGAKLAIGLRTSETRARVREAAISGEIVDKLRWIPANAGDTFLLPAGTIHAIGAGLTLCEVQQPSDVTYRLYDFGRGRELQLDKALDVGHLGPFDAYIRSRGDLLAECRYFRTEKVRVRGTFPLESRNKGYRCIVIAGDGKLAGNAFVTGDAWEIAAGEGPLAVESADATLLTTQVP
jgi:mannose-6-phosphate isomerase